MKKTATLIFLFMFIVNGCISTLSETTKPEIIIEAAITPGSFLIGRSLNQTNFESEVNCEVVGVQRGISSDIETLNSLKLNPGNILLLKGSEKSIRSLRGIKDIFPIEWSTIYLPSKLFALRARLIFVATIFALPFVAKKPIELLPSISVELIQISDQTNIPFAPKAEKIIEKVKKEKEKLVSEQAPPKKVKKEKPDAIPLPDQDIEKLKKVEKDKQNPKIEDNKAKQVSEFEKKELFDPNNIAALIDKSKENFAETNIKNDDISQSDDESMKLSGLTLNEEDALKAQIFGCWSIPLGLPYNENLLVRIKLKLKPDGSVIKSEILDHARMNKPGQGFYKVLAESALRAIQLCQPLRVPTTGYEKWKDLQLNFDAREMLEG